MTQCLVVVINVDNFRLEGVDALSRRFRSHPFEREVHRHERNVDVAQGADFRNTFRDTCDVDPFASARDQVAVPLSFRMRRLSGLDVVRRNRFDGQAADRSPLAVRDGGAFGKLRVRGRRNQDDAVRFAQLADSLRIEVMDGVVGHQNQVGGAGPRQVAGAPRIDLNDRLVEHELDARVDEWIDREQCVQQKQSHGAGYYGLETERHWHCYGYNALHDETPLFARSDVLI